MNKYMGIKYLFVQPLFDDFMPSFSNQSFTEGLSFSPCFMSKGRINDNTSNLKDIQRLFSDRLLLVFLYDHTECTHANHSMTQLCLSHGIWKRLIEDSICHDTTVYLKLLVSVSELRKGGWAVVVVVLEWVCLACMTTANSPVFQHKKTTHQRLERSPENTDKIGD